MPSFRRGRGRSSREADPRKIARATNGRRPSSGRPSTRSTAAARAGRPRPTGARSSGRRNVTGRAAILALVVCALLLTLAYPLRAYLGQRAKISDLNDRTAASQVRVAQLQQENERWKDPAYVAEQARERLGYLKPGEKGYVTLDGGGTVDDEENAAGGQADLLDRAARQEAWYDRMLESFTRPGVPMPAPAEQ